MSAAARASWLVPTAALALVAIHEQLPRTTVPLLLGAASISAVIGLILGVVAFIASPSARAHALAGAVASAAVLVVSVTSGVAGAAAMREAQRTLESTTTAALRDSPGWSGQGVTGTTHIVASSLDRRTEASKVMTHPFDRPLRVLVLAIDNRTGDHPVVLDLENVHVRVAGGAVRASVSRDDLLHMSGEAPPRLAGSVRVPAGERFDLAQVFFAEDVNFRDVEAVELLVDREPLVLQGRYFTLAEKRAIDAARVH
jgi:hypothetical protein